MKINKLFLFVFAVFLFACTPMAAEAVQTSSAVQVPGALVLALDAIILTGATLGLQVVFENFGLDLRGLGTALAASLSGFGILQLQGVIDVIPMAYDQLVTIALNIAVVVLAGVGYVRLLTNRDRASQAVAPRK